MAISSTRSSVAKARILSATSAASPIKANCLICSAFACSLFAAVYGITGLPRTSKEQYDATRRVNRDDLQEGDLVFFHTLGKHRTVTHVGVYLRNNKFIHASISGVMISDMNDGYYDKHYVGAGRIIPGS